MQRIEKTVFISYRRTNLSWALAVFQNLTSRGYDAFLDYDGIGPGDFESAILGNITSRAHFLILLTPSALERCGEPGDWLRREIETALDSKRNIVPLMLEGFSFSTPQIAGQLTGTLARLKKYNGLEIPATYFLEAMEKLHTKFLNLPLDAVVHPASQLAQQAATKQKAAARAAPATREAELTAQPTRAVELPFLMPIEDIFSISGRGTVVTGRIERGKIKVGEDCEIVGFRETRKTVCTGVEMFKKQLDEGGDIAGLLLRGIEKEDLERGMVLAKPGSITAHTTFKGEIYMLSKEEGGRHAPFFDGYRPQFWFRATEVTGSSKLPAGAEMAMPGENISLEVTLHTPVAMEKGQRFAVREGGRTIGAGTISEIIQ